MSSHAKQQRERKEKHPERFCPARNCMWRAESGPCPKHQKNATEESLRAAENAERSGNTMSTACAEAWEEAARIYAVPRLNRAWLAFSLALERAMAHALPRPLPGKHYGKAAW